MTKILNILSYYILLLFGLIGTSWIIWSRYIRQRIIRDIPDDLLTEYRFWILLYICLIYIYSVKNLWKSNTSPIIKEIATYFRDMIYKPLKTLDQFVKYNKIIEPYYYAFSLQSIGKILKLTSTSQKIIIFSLQIFPRIILVIFLLADTFYFNKLEIFYKVVLIGLLPFIFRYIKYSFKEISNHFIQKLENKYYFVYIFEENCDYTYDNDNKTKAIHHYKRATIKEYIEIKYENVVAWLSNKVNFEYTGDPYLHSALQKQYCLQKYNNEVAPMTKQDEQIVSKLFYELTDIIIELKLFYNKFELINEQIYFKITKTIIYLLYSICWSYILSISFYYYPITLTMFNYLINNIQLYLTMPENPFIDHTFSQNTNMITPESIYNLIKMIIIVIINKIL